MEVIETVEILLVEDNVLDAELTMRGLKGGQIGGNVTWLKDGQQALDYLLRAGDYADRGPGEPRLILLDLKMPRVDGIEVLRRIKAEERTRRIPVVIMTSSQEESDMVQSYDLGANSYLVKPIAFDSLTDIARQAGLYWLGMNRGSPR
jgi:CheY-like chemotaxis protein